jgi:L-lactate dehydrogenase complex protein LldE
MAPAVEVGLFIPCYVDQFYPRVGMATVELLERHGVAVDYPQDQSCCGQPLFNSGLNHEARPVAERFLSLFSRYQYVVCPSGSCTSMVRHHYPDLCRPSALLSQVASRTYELCEFLHDVLKVQPSGRFPHKVGLHNSCHGLRELRLGSGSERLVAPFNKVRDLLAGLTDLRLVDLARDDDCCGFGGAFAVDEEAVSCAMGEDRVRDHRQAGAEIITGADMSCLMHLDGLLQRQAGAPGLRVMHVAEILSEAAEAAA